MTPPSSRIKARLATLSCGLFLTCRGKVNRNCIRYVLYVRIYRVNSRPSPMPLGYWYFVADTFCLPIRFVSDTFCRRYVLSRYVLSLYHYIQTLSSPAKCYMLLSLPLYGISLAWLPLFRVEHCSNPILIHFWHPHIIQLSIYHRLEWDPLCTVYADERDRRIKIWWNIYKMVQKVYILDEWHIIYQH